MTKITQTLLLGLLLWGFPFLLGFIFYDQHGKLNADIFLFKSIMLLALVFATMFSNHLITLKTNSNFLRQGITTSVIWLCTLFVLDWLILVPMADLSTIDYITQVGSRYLIIPIITVFSGKTLDRKLLIKD